MARREAELRELTKKFVCVRMVKMNGVDLRQFQFDYDMAWAALFLHPDGTVYARYGSRTVDGPMVTNSAKGLVRTMRRVLAAHEQYPNHRERFLSKRGPDPRFGKPEDYPYLETRRKISRVTRGNCIHCHNVHEAFHDLQKRQTGRPERVFKFPFPRNAGFEIEPDSGNRVASVLPDSPALATGLEPGDTIVAMNGQAIFSLADIQFVLHHLADMADVEITLERAARPLRKTLRLDGDWRRNDFTWRVSLGDFASSPGYYLRMLRSREKSRLDLGDEELALQVEGLFTPVARASGLEKGDIIIGIDGRKGKLSAPKFHAYLRVQHSTPTTTARMTVLRERELREIEVRFFE